MGQHHIERRAAARGGIEQPLELRPVVGRADEAGIDKLANDFPAPRLAESQPLATLIGDGEIAFGLAAGRDACRARRARASRRRRRRRQAWQRFSWPSSPAGGNIRDFSMRPRHFPVLRDQIAEGCHQKRFNSVDLGIRYRQSC